MLIHPEKVSLTTVLGAASGNTQNLNGIVYEILVKPTTSTTTYDITLTDSSGVVIFEQLSETGTLNEVNMLPVWGVYTISLANATANEAFLVKLMMHEQ